MFVNVGINWAGSLLVFFALALTLAPVLFAVYDPKLREKSKFASSPKTSGGGEGNFGGKNENDGNR
jgi:hypothetical protein